MAKQKSIAISGASKGIGLSIAARFHKEGWKVLISARGAYDLYMAEQAYPGLKTFACDMGLREGVKSFADFILGESGPPDVLVNNAGVFLPGAISDEEDGVFEQMIAVNLASAYHLSRGLLPGMKERGSGTILNMCSTASLKAYPNGGSYGISKHGLLGFSRCLREEMKGFGIRVISVLPGATYTASWENSGQKEERMMPPEDIAELVWASINLSDRSVVEEILLRPFLGDI